MTDLLIKDVDDDLLKALEEQAASHDRSTEAELQAILKTALKKKPRKSFVQALREMPNVGKDSDFERIQDAQAPDVGCEGR